MCGTWQQHRRTAAGCTCPQRQCWWGRAAAASPPSFYMGKTISNDDLRETAHEKFCPSPWCFSHPWHSAVKKKCWKRRTGMMSPRLSTDYFQGYFHWEEGTGCASVRDLKSWLQCFAAVEGHRVSGVFSLSCFLYLPPFSLNQGKGGSQHHHYVSTTKSM